MRLRSLSGALALVLSLTGCDSRSVDIASINRDPDDVDAGYFATDTDILETFPNGEPRYRLRAAQARQNPATGATELRGVTMELRTDGDDRWRLRAERGVMAAHAQRVELAGDVRLDSARSRDALQLRTATLAYDIDAARARAPGLVEIEVAGGRLQAHAVAVDLKTRRVSLESKVHGHFTP